MIEDFFVEIDESWKPIGMEPYRLPIIGSTALFLQCDYTRVTKDSDIWQVNVLTDEIAQRLESLAGVGTTIERRHRMYLDIVKNGTPFLPHPPRFHILENLNQQLHHFRVEVLDMVDVVVSKLKPFRAQDMDDIRYLADHALIDPSQLVSRFESAVEYWSMDARATQLPKYVENLHVVQRDLLGVEESVVELPRWISE